MARVVLAMSGGVDSSVAGHLLQADGHDVIGVFMRHGETAPADIACSAASTDSQSAADSGRLAPRGLLPVLGQRSDHRQGCCSASDADDARRVAQRLAVPFYALDLSRDFDRIIDEFVDQYRQGRTPNPCVLCNTWIKFGRLFDFADSVAAEYVATGHYAQVGRAADGHAALLRGRDTNKDQSYSLFGIDRDRLARMLLPVGGYRKPEIRELASSLELSVANKRDSQEICFVTQGHHAEFVRKRRGASQAGPIVLTNGRVVGQHDGIEAFTIGQRKGLGVALGTPAYVVRIDPQSNTVVLGAHDDLAVEGLDAARCNWLVDQPNRGFACQVQTRYNGRPADAQVEVDPQSDHLCVRFDQPQHGVAPGQAVVCYDGDRLLGGGWIERTF